MLATIIICAAIGFATLALVARLVRGRTDPPVVTWVCTACGAEFPDEWEAGLHVEVAHRKQSRG